MPPSLGGGTMVYGSEKPITKRTRKVIVLVLWLIIGLPVFVGLSFVMGWWVLLFLAVAVWATVDYVKRGDMYSAVDHAVSHHVRTGEDSKSRFGTDD
jgi:hypothetical protein